MCVGLDSVRDKEHWGGAGGSEQPCSCGLGIAMAMAMTKLVNSTLLDISSNCLRLVKHLREISICNDGYCSTVKHGAFPRSSPQHVHSSSEVRLWTMNAFQSFAIDDY